MVVKQMCTNCGIQLEKDMGFCTSCGTKMEPIDESSVSQDTSQETEEIPVKQEPGQRSFIQGLAGHATDSSVEEAVQTYGEMLVNGENILAAYKWARDEVVFTSLRIIYQDVQGITGKKKSFLSIPYSSIHKFSKESAGWLDLDAELRVWIRGEAEPIKWEFRKDAAVNKIFSIISERVLT